MPKSQFALLDPRIANMEIIIPKPIPTTVGCEPAPPPPFFGMVKGTELLIDRRVCPLDYAEETPATSWTRIEELADAVVAACGTSRSRTLAGLRAFQMSHTLAACMPQTAHCEVALGKALGLDSDLVKREVGEWGASVDPWLAGDENRMDGPTVADVVALKIIAAVRVVGTGPVPKSIRRAIFGVFAWYRWKGRCPSIAAVNALGCVVGLIDPATAQIRKDRLALLLSANPERLAAVAEAYYASEATNDRSKIRALQVSFEVETSEYRREIARLRRKARESGYTLNSAVMRERAETNVRDAFSTLVKQNGESFFHSCFGPSAPKRGGARAWKKWRREYRTWQRFKATA